MLKAGHFGNDIKNEWEVFNCVGIGWRDQLWTDPVRNDAVL